MTGCGKIVETKSTEDTSETFNAQRNEITQCKYRNYLFDIYTTGISINIVDNFQNWIIWSLIQ
jgi:hypothetical protein